VGFSALELLWQFFSRHGNTELVLSPSKRHGITPKDLKQKVFVGFGVFVANLFLPSK
jgi:hypothetical protein